MVQSKNCIQYKKGHDNSGIFGIATDKGEIEKALGKIIGFHAPKVIVVVDEMPYTPEAIVEACVNLETGAEHFQFIGLGNADDMLDPHGRMCEPLRGWDSVCVETEEWRTKRGLCLHLDGLKSPNLRKNGMLFPGLLNQADIDSTIEIYGADSPQFWQMRRGFWAPEGIQKTVLSMPMIVRTDAMGETSFDYDSVNVASLDPSFEGGDRCVLRFGKVGKVRGKGTLLLGEHVFIKTMIRVDDPIHYQIARKVKQECISRQVDPFYFGLDATGEGGGLASIIQREWSREILCVEFGGRPPRTPVSPTNSKQADMEYDRQVTYLWFYFRLLLLNEQIKGLDFETASEFCRRWWSMKGPYVSLETKEKMKDRTRKSPDLADNAVIMAQVAHLRCGMSANEFGEWNTERDSPWKRFMIKRQLDSSYAAPFAY